MTDNHRNMHKYDLVLGKYCVTQSGYFRFATTVAFGMGSTYAKILFWHGILKESRDKKITMREYNDRTLYD